MFTKAGRGAFCLVLVVGFLLAAPQNPRSLLNFSDSALSTRAERKGAAVSEPDFDLSRPETGAVCTAAPDYPKDTAPNISSNPEPAPSDKPPKLQIDRKQEIQSLIRYPWEELGFKIIFMGPRLGYRAMTLTAKRRIEVYLRPGESVSQQAYDLAHELGHAFDLKYNDDARRRQWRQLRGIKISAPWFGCDACPDYATPAGDFAETFAFLLLGPGNFHSLIAPLPGVEKVSELAAFCHIDHLSDVLEAQLKKQEQAEKIQSARIPKSVRLPKENRATEAVANMSKAAQIQDGREESLSDFESPQKEAAVALHSSNERLFEVTLPEENQQPMIPISLPASK